MVVGTDSSRTMPDWVKYGVFWHVYPLGFCGADISPPARASSMAAALTR